MGLGSGINKIVLVGHILKDGRNHHHQQETLPNVHFSLVTEDALIKDGMEVVNQEYHNIKVPGKIAGQMRFLKGCMIFLEGSIKTKSFIDAGGTKRYRSEVWVEQYKLLN